MDLTRFDDTQFDVKKWVNDAIQKQIQNQKSSSSISTDDLNDDSSTSHVEYDPKGIEFPLQQMVNQLQFLQQDLHQYIQQQYHIFVSKRVPVALMELQRCATVAQHLMKKLHILALRVQLGQKLDVDEIVVNKQRGRFEQEEEDSSADLVQEEMNTKNSREGEEEVADVMVLQEREQEKMAIQTLEQLHWLHEQLKTCIDVVNVHQTLAHSFAQLESDLAYDRWMTGLPDGGDDGIEQGQLLAQLEALSKEYETIERGQKLLSKAIPNVDQELSGFSREQVLQMRNRIEAKLKQFLLQLLTHVFCARWEDALDVSKLSGELDVYVESLQHIGRLSEIIKPVIIDPLVKAVQEYGQFQLTSYETIESYLRVKTSCFQVIQDSFHKLQNNRPTTATTAGTVSIEPDGTVTAARFRSLFIANILTRTVNNANVVSQPNTLTAWTEEFARAVKFYDEQMLGDESQKEQQSYNDKDHSVNESILRRAIFSRFDKVLHRYAEEERAASSAVIASMMTYSSTDMFDLVNKLDSVGEQFFHIHLANCVDRCRILTFGIESQALVRVINDAVVKFCSQAESLVKKLIDKKAAAAATSMNVTDKKQSHYFYDHTMTLQSLNLVSLVHRWKHMFQQQFKQALGSALLSWSKMDHPLRNLLFGDDKYRSAMSFFKSAEMDLPLLDIANRRLDGLDMFVHDFCVDLFLSRARDLLQNFESYYKLADDDKTPYDLPNFRSRSNGEHITQIGEWIITLPGQLEKLSIESDSGTSSNNDNIEQQQQQQQQQQQRQKNNDDDDDEEQEDVVQKWLDEICEGVIATIMEKFLQMEQSILSRNSWSQLHADMNYLNSVLDVIGYENAAFSGLLLILDMETRDRMNEEIKKKSKKLGEHATRALTALMNKFKRT